MTHQRHEEFYRRVGEMHDDAMSAFVMDMMSSDRYPPEQREYLRAICHYTAAFLDGQDDED